MIHDNNKSELKTKSKYEKYETKLNPNAKFITSNRNQLIIRMWWINRLTEWVCASERTKIVSFTINARFISMCLCVCAKNVDTGWFEGCTHSVFAALRRISTAAFIHSRVWFHFPMNTRTCSQTSFATGIIDSISILLYCISVYCISFGIGMNKRPKEKRRFHTRVRHNSYSNNNIVVNTNSWIRFIHSLACSRTPNWRRQNHDMNT